MGSVTDTNHAHNGSQPLAFKNRPFIQIAPQIVDTWLPHLSLAQLRVYLVLARQANNFTQVALIGQQTIARKAGVSERWARKTLNDLEGLGLIEARGLARLASGARVQSYLLLAPELATSGANRNSSAREPELDTSAVLDSLFKTQGFKTQLTRPAALCRKIPTPAREQEKIPAPSLTAPVFSGARSRTRHSRDDLSLSEIAAILGFSEAEAANFLDLVTVEDFAGFFQISQSEAAARYAPLIRIRPFTTNGVAHRATTLVLNRTTRRKQ